MSQRNRSTRSQRALNQSPRPTTSQRARRDSSPIYSELHNPSEQSQDDLRENEKKMFVAASCKYILGMTKRKLPIKCADLVKICMQGENRLFAEIFEVVSNQLSQLYGLEAREIKDDKLSKIILCFSTVPTGSELEFTKHQRIDMELLFIVLSYIQMKGDTVAETTLFGFLKRLGVQDEPHERFGHFKKKITETFTRQLYLKREKVQIEGDAEDRIQYTWGRRAQLEVSPEKVTEAVAKIFQVPSSVFQAQHNNESDEENDEGLETSDIEMNGN